MFTQHIALVPEAHGVSPSELSRVSAALQKQVTRDVARFWNVQATVSAFPTLEEVPFGYWPIIVTFCSLGEDAGIHVDKHGQPFAQIEMTASWSLEASRACIEMLINPYGYQTVIGISPRADQGLVAIAVEPCSACADVRNAYCVNDVLVSDFCTPQFFEDGTANDTSRYSFSGSIEAPLQILSGGHLTWYEPVSDSWWLRTNFGGTIAETRLAGVQGRVGSARQLAGDAALKLSASAAAVETLSARVGVPRERGMQASQFRAHRLRTELAGRSHLDRSQVLDARPPQSTPPPLPLAAQAAKATPSTPPRAASEAIYVQPQEVHLAPHVESGAPAEQAVGAPAAEVSNEYSAVPATPAAVPAGEMARAATARTSPPPRSVPPAEEVHVAPKAASLPPPSPLTSNSSAPEARPISSLPPPLAGKQPWQTKSSSDSPARMVLLIAGGLLVMGTLVALALRPSAGSSSGATPSVSGATSQRTEAVREPAPPAAATAAAAQPAPALDVQLAPSPVPQGAVQPVQLVPPAAHAPAEVAAQSDVTVNEAHHASHHTAKVAAPAETEIATSPAPQSAAKSAVAAKAAPADELDALIETRR